MVEKKTQYSVTREDLDSFLKSKDCPAEVKEKLRIANSFETALGFIKDMGTKVGMNTLSPELRFYEDGTVSIVDCTDPELQQIFEKAFQAYLIYEGKFKTKLLKIVDKVLLG